MVVFSFTFSTKHLFSLTMESTPQCQILTMKMVLDILFQKQLLIIIVECSAALAFFNFICLRDDRTASQNTLRGHYHQCSQSRYSQRSVFMGKTRKSFGNQGVLDTLLIPQVPTDEQSSAITKNILYLDD